MAMPAETPTQVISRPRFADWLRDICARGGVSRSRLYMGFIRAGGECNEKTMRRWINGTNDPPAWATHLLVKVLDQEIEDLDVYDEVKTFYMS